MIRSLAFKFALAFLTVSLLGILFVAIFASQVSQREFANFLDAQEQVTLVTELADLYQSRGGWDGINMRTIRSVTSTFSTAGPGVNFAIADHQGIIIVPSPAHDLGSQPAARTLSQGIPIEVDGEQVGTLITPATRVAQIQPKITTFSERINNALLWGGVIAAAISLILALTFSRTLARRLGEISHAAQAIANGDLQRKIPVNSKDEIGQLATSFNQMSAELARSQVLRRQMTADIAHELRTPLSIILGRAETLAEGMLPPSQEVFTVIHDEAKRINRLVEDLRTLTISDAGELSLEFRPASIQSILDDTIKSHTASATQKGVKLLLNTYNPPAQIMVDPDRIKQVLDNLISNALRYTPDGGEITLSATGVSHGVEICLHDTGSGISPEDLPYVFDRFYRGDKSRQRHRGGSGLGLAIANSLVTAHGGQISVTSEPGRGTSFTIWLPQTV